MELHKLQSTVKRSHKRLGRGHGSGRGKTSGRGTKGQKARGTVPQYFEGGQLSVMKRLPFLRGKARNKSLVAKPVIIKVSALGAFPAKAEVTVKSLQKSGLVAENVKEVKILSGGSLSVALTVMVPCSQGARDVIEKAGGKVV